MITTEETTAPTITFEDLQHSKDYWVAVQAVAPGNSNTHLSDALATATVTLVFQKPNHNENCTDSIFIKLSNCFTTRRFVLYMEDWAECKYHRCYSVQTTTAVQPGNFQTHKFDGLTYATEYYVDVRVENDQHLVIMPIQ